MELYVGTPRSIAALLAAKAHGNRILLVARKDQDQDVRRLSDLNPFGTICTLLDVLKLPDGIHKVAVRGEHVCRLSTLEDGQTHFTAAVEIVGAASDQELGIVPPPAATERPDDIIQETMLIGFDPLGEPALTLERRGGLWLVFSHMPPTWAPEEEYKHFGRFRSFDNELAEAIGCSVLWDDREFFYIEHPKPDTAERIQTFLHDYRRKNERH